ncbi:MAG: hypothetical protein P8Q97_07670 [Myxococcota bacterium]|jgi:hypothetical protein|nr:hypothetical protein [Myxococcota bacterium]
MAKTTIPDPIKRRHLIEQDLGEAQCLALADAYEAEGRTFESLQFLEKAGAKDRMAEVVERAVASGDAFLLKQVSDLMGQDPGAQRWSSLAEVAEREGLERYAEMAHRHARSSEE